MSEISVQLPDYDQDVFARKYEELAQFQVTIPGDPIGMGYAGVNQMYSSLYAMISRVDELLAEANRMVAEAETVYGASKCAFEAKMDAKLAALTKDQYESIKLVEAKVKVELADDLKLSQRAKLVLGLLKAYRKAVEGKRGNLDAAMGILEQQNNNLKRQLPSMQTLPNGQRL